MRTIVLGGRKAAGRVALVDDEDFEMACQRAWHVHGHVRPGGGIDGPYAKANLGGGATIFLHNLITGLRYIDHVNGDGLDCRRSNLRAATKSQNGANRRSSAGSSSRYKGVSARRGRWQARIRVNGQFVYLGVFGSEEEAARTYDAAALAAWGEFARLNFH